ncbi:uncharacterized protein LOC134820657 [Bolinopsis microptera]|uniref:uncharacterized protein LOC134820657 n=1 Tax=Bolinopsis microptera TaxID=2820187 RepID=UPI0030796B51
MNACYVLLVVTVVLNLTQGLSLAKRNAIIENTSEEGGMRASEELQTPLRGLSEEMQMPSRGGGLSEELQMPSHGRGLSEEMQMPSRGGGLSEEMQMPSRGGGLSEEMQMPSRGGGLSEDMQMPSRGGGLSEEMQTPLRGKNTEENFVPLRRMSEEVDMDDIALREMEAPWETYDVVPFKSQASAKKRPARG